jgi:hypothetical protein
MTENIESPDSKNTLKETKPRVRKPRVKDINNPVVVERLKLWIALISLLAALLVGGFSIYQSRMQSQHLQTVTVAIQDTEDIRNALKKPFEGVWQYRIVFSRYFGNEATYISSGTAIILWEPAKQQYQIFIGYSISKEWEKEKLVTGFLGGNFLADGQGWPSENFEMPMRYLERTSVGEFNNPNAAGFSFTKGSYKKSPDGKQVEQIFADYGNSRSVGKMTMVR